MTTTEYRNRTITTEFIPEQHHDWGGTTYAHYEISVDGRKWDRKSDEAKGIAAVKKAIDQDIEDTEITPALLAFFGVVDGAEAQALPDASPATQKGDHVVIFSRGRNRKAVVTKVGRSNVTVAYTTDSAVRDHVQKGYRVQITRKSVPFAHAGVIA